MSTVATTKTVKEIRIDVAKCTGCRACEMACSAFHAKPRYSSVNPSRSRIRVVADEIRDEYVPVRAGNLTRSECDGRHYYQINDKRYSECSFCRAACPSRDYFTEPDSGLPLKCDMCEDEPALAEPLCVTVCQPGCLTYEVRQLVTPVDEDAEREVLQRGLETLAKMHGIEAVIEQVKRAAKGD